MRCERRPTGTMEPRRHPVIVLICFALVTNSIFAACPTHTGAPPEETPHFDLQHYATGDWFGLRNILYDYGIEITGGYTTEPAGNPIGGIEHGFTYLHNFGFGVLFDLQKIAGIPDTTFLVTISQRSGRGSLRTRSATPLACSKFSAAVRPIGWCKCGSIKSCSTIAWSFPTAASRQRRIF
jgi:carbohydrate-selective porin OprB